VIDDAYIAANVPTVREQLAKAGTNVGIKRIVVLVSYVGVNVLDQQTTLPSACDQIPHATVPFEGRPILDKPILARAKRRIEQQHGGTRIE